MPDWFATVLLFVVIGVIYLVVRYVGDKIVDKGGDAIDNAFKREKSSTDGKKRKISQIAFKNSLVYGFTKIKMRRDIIMRKTYAPNAIIIGVLIGILVALKVNVILGVLAGLGVSVLGWVVIRSIERAADRAGDALDDAIRKKINEGKGKK